MTAIKDKVTQFLDLFGDKGKEILTAAESTEKAADEAGVEFKEASEAADTPAAAAPVEPAAQPAADAPETKEAPPAEPAPVEAETEKAAKPEPEAEKPEADGEDLEDEEDFEAMGDMEVKAYGSMMGEVMTKAMGPVMESLDRIEKALTAKKEAPEPPAVDPNQAKIAELETTVKELTQRLAVIMSEAPRAVQAGFVASQADATVLKEGSPLANAAGPKPDPLNEFAKFAMGGIS